MFDWTAISEDPISSVTTQAYIQHMKSIRKTYKTFEELLSRFVKGKRVLDIGMADHTIESTEKAGWRHASIVNEASYVLGVDINESLVNYLSNKGYNVMCIDATSDASLEETFDIIFMGDVIEHVNNPLALLKFAKRHLSPTDGSRIIVSTPNPNFINTILNTIRKSTMIANFEHTCAIAPPHMNELCRRSDLRFLNYYMRDARSADRFVNRLLKTIIPLGELYTSKYVYVLG